VAKGIIKNNLEKGEYQVEVVYEDENRWDRLRESLDEKIDELEDRKSEISDRIDDLDNEIDILLQQARLISDDINSILYDLRTLNEERTDFVEDLTDLEKDLRDLRKTPENEPLIDEESLLEWEGRLALFETKKDSNFIFEGIINSELSREKDRTKCYVGSQELFEFLKVETDNIIRDENFSDYAPGIDPLVIANYFLNRKKWVDFVNVTIEQNIEYSKAFQRDYTYFRGGSHRVDGLIDSCIGLIQAILSEINKGNTFYQEALDFWLAYEELLLEQIENIEYLIYKLSSQIRAKNKILFFISKEKSMISGLIQDVGVIIDDPGLENDAYWQDEIDQLTEREFEIDDNQDDLEGSFDEKETILVEGETELDTLETTLGIVRRLSCEICVDENEPDENIDILEAAVNAKELEISEKEQEIDNKDEEIKSKEQDKADKTTEYEEKLTGLQEKRGEKKSYEIKKKEIEADIKNREKLRNYFGRIWKSNTTETLWCVDFIDDLENEEEVGLYAVGIDRDFGFGILPMYEDRNLYDQDEHGILLSDEMLPPAQWVYNNCTYNATQKWKPTFRYATIDSLDYENHLCNVTLKDENSKIKNYPINRETVFNDIPIEYMNCHSSRFEEGDEVLVYFQNHDYIDAKVIGFKEEPKPCQFKFYLKPTFNGYLASRGNEQIRIVYPRKLGEPTVNIDAKFVFGDDYEGDNPDFFKEELAGPFVIEGQYFEKDKEIDIKLHSDIKLYDSDVKLEHRRWNRHAFTFWYEVPEVLDGFAEFAYQISDKDSPGIDNQIIKVGRNSPEPKFFKRVIWKEATEKLKMGDEPAYKVDVLFPGKENEEEVPVYEVEFTGLKVLKMSQNNPIGGGFDACSCEFSLYNYVHYVDDIEPPEEGLNMPFHSDGVLAASIPVMELYLPAGQTWQQTNFPQGAGNNLWGSWYLCCSGICSMRWTAEISNQLPSIPFSADCYVIETDEDGEGPNYTPMQSERFDSQEIIYYEGGEEPECQGGPAETTRLRQTEMIDTPGDFF
jgi:hypothetical protein